MKENKNIINKVNETMNLLDNVDKVEANPFFKTQLEGKIENLEAKKSMNISFYFSRLQIKPVLVTLLVVLNLIFISLLVNSTYVNKNQNNEITNLIETYAFDQTEYFSLIENNE